MPEYGPIAMMLAAVAIGSIATVEVKRRSVSYRMRVDQMNSMGIEQEEFFYKKNIGRFPHKSMSTEDIRYANSFYENKV